MEYERIHKVQMGVISPSKLRMKLLGPHTNKKKGSESLSSRTTSPAKLEEMASAKNSLLAADEEVDSSKNLIGSSVLNAEETSEAPKQSKGKADTTLTTSNLSTVHPGRPSEEDANGYDSSHDNGSTSSFEFHRGERATQHAVVVGPFFRHVPSKWNDAEKWLVNRQMMHPNGMKKNLALTQGSHIIMSNCGRVAPESLFADQKHLVIQAANTKRTDSINPALQNAAEKFLFPPCPKSASESVNEASGVTNVSPHSDDSYSTPRLQKEINHQGIVGTAVAPCVQSVCMRDIGTEMTPVPSQEPSRTGTPAGATTPTCSPISSLPSTPKREVPELSPGDTVTVTDADLHKKVGQAKLSEKDLQLKTRKEIVALGLQLGKMNIASWASKDDAEHVPPSSTTLGVDQHVKAEYEMRAISWEEAELSRNMARYKHEEVKIQAWEKQQNAKIEAKMRKIEAQAEQMKAHAQERMIEKLAVTRLRVVEKQAAAEAWKNQHAARTAQQVEQIRQTGRVPSSHRRCCTWFF